jgi:hypothetical protein
VLGFRCPSPAGPPPAPGVPLSVHRAPPRVFPAGHPPLAADAGFGSRGRDGAAAVAVARHFDAGGAGEHDLPLSEPPALVAMRKPRKSKPSTGRCGLAGFSPVTAAVPAGRARLPPPPAAPRRGGGHPPPRQAARRQLVGRLAAPAYVRNHPLLAAGLYQLALFGSIRDGTQARQYDLAGTTGMKRWTAACRAQIPTGGHIAAYG